MVGSYLPQMNLRSGRGSTSAGAGHSLGEGQGESGRGNKHGNRESHEAPLLAPPPLPPPPPMTQAEMLAARRESAHAMELLAQAIGGFTRGGHGGHGGNGGGVRGPEGPYSYQDFLKTHPPMFMPMAKPMDAEHWLRILEQMFLFLTVTEEQKVHFVVQ